MEAPSSQVVLVQGMQNKAERELSHKLVKETLGTGKLEEKEKKLEKDIRRWTKNMEGRAEGCCRADSSLAQTTTTEKHDKCHSPDSCMKVVGKCDDSPQY